MLFDCVACFHSVSVLAVPLVSAAAEVCVMFAKIKMPVHFRFPTNVSVCHMSSLTIQVCVQPTMHEFYLVL